MACGWTPDLLRLLEAAGDEKQKAARQAEQELAQTTQQLAVARRRADNVLSETVGRRDWTAVYEKWDAWEDPEELAQREQQVREKHERAGKAAAAAGCNHDHSAEQKLMDMTTRAKLDACDEFRRLGNAFFRQGQFERAAYHYHRALVYFEYIFPDTKPEDDEMESLKLKTLVNFMTARLKTGHWEDVLHHAKQALEIDAENVRALYGLAHAHRRRDEFDEALDALARLDKATESRPEEVDPLVAQEKRLLQAKMLAYKLRSKHLSVAMFGGEAARDKTPAVRSVSSVRDVPLQLSTMSVVGGPGDGSDLALDDTSRPYVAGMDELDEMIRSME